MSQPQPGLTQLEMIVFKLTLVCTSIFERPSASSSALSVSQALGKSMSSIIGTLMYGSDIVKSLCITRVSDTNERQI